MFPTRSIGNLRLDRRGDLSETSDVGNLLKDRVEARLEALQINAFEAARRGELERGFVNDILAGRKETIRGGNLAKLAKALQCSTNYFIEEDAGAQPGRAGVEVGIQPPDSSVRNHVQIPEYDVRLSAGPGALTGDEPAVDVWSFSDRYVTHTLGLRSQSLSVVEVIGDSMEPTLESGDRVLIDHSDRNPARGGIFAVWDGDATVVKRLERVPGSSPREVVLISDNQRHNQYRVNEADLHVIGRVAWIGRRV